MQEGSQTQPTILVIDDSEIVLEMTRFTLESAGYRVLTRDRAQGSIVAILHEQPDLVLLDVNMPSMSGESIAEILARSAPARGTLIVLYSSLPENALRMKTVATGAHGFIQKTSVQAELVRQVRAFLEQPASRNGVRRPDSSASSPRILAVRESTRPGSASSPPPRRDSGTLRLAVPRALFVDDDITVLSAYRRAFSTEELIGEYVTSAEQAARRLTQPDPPDVVVTDLVLPGMNGMELYRRAVELDPSYRQRFVFVTGAQSVSYVAEFLREVGGRALEKPVDTRRLHDAIRYSATGARILRKLGEG